MAVSLAETIAADFSLSKNGPPSTVPPSRRPSRGRPGYNSDHLNGGERRHSPSITSRSRSRSADMAPAAAAAGAISRPYYRYTPSRDRSSPSPPFPAVFKFGSAAGFRDNEDYVLCPPSLPPSVGLSPTCSGKRRRPEAIARWGCA